MSDRLIHPLLKRATHGSNSKVCAPSAFLATSPATGHKYTALDTGQGSRGCEAKTDLTFGKILNRMLNYFNHHTSYKTLTMWNYFRFLWKKSAMHFPTGCLVIKGTVTYHFAKFTCIVSVLSYTMYLLNAMLNTDSLTYGVKFCS